MTHDCAIHLYCPDGFNEVVGTRLVKARLNGQDVSHCVVRMYEAYRTHPEYSHPHEYRPLHMDRAGFRVEADEKYVLADLASAIMDFMTLDVELHDHKDAPPEEDY